MSGSKKNSIFYLENDDVKNFRNSVIIKKGNFKDNLKKFLEGKNKKIVELDKLNVSRVTNMDGMFEGAESFNEPIGNWKVSKVKDMSYMFGDAKSFNQPIGNWDVSKVTSMLGTFCDAESFNQPIGNWNVSNVEVIGNMFMNAKSFNQDISKWDIRKTEDIVHIDFPRPLKPLIAYSVYQWYIDKKITRREAQQIFGFGGAELHKYEQMLENARTFTGNVKLSNRVKRNLMKEFKKKGSKMTDAKFKRLTKSTFSKNPEYEGDLDATLKALNHEPIFDEIMRFIDPKGTEKRKSVSKKKSTSKSKSASKSPKNKRQTKSASKPKSANQTRSAKRAKSV